MNLDGTWIFYGKGDGKTIVAPPKTPVGGTLVKESVHPGGLVLLKYKIAEDSQKNPKDSFKVIVAYRGTKADAIKMAQSTDMPVVPKPAAVVVDTTSIFDRLPVDWLCAVPSDWKTGAMANKDLLVKANLLKDGATPSEMVSIHGKVRDALVQLHGEAAVPK